MATTTSDPGGEPSTSDRLVRTAIDTVVPALLLGCLLGVLLLRARLPLSNADTYFHLRLGREFLDGWSLRHPGQPSGFSSADWTPTQWLPEVAMTTVSDHLGLAGLAWLAGAWSTLYLACVVLLCRRGAGLAVTAVVTFLAVLATGYGFTMRPQLLGFSFLALTVAAWLRSADRGGRPPWLLVPLTWVWAMCHGLWIVGVTIGVVAALALTLDLRDGLRGAARRLAVPVLGLAAACATPVGPALLGAVAQVGSRGSYFSEWAPPDFTAPYGLAFLVLWGFATGVLLRRGDGTWWELAALGLALAFALYSLRTLPAATVLVVPIVAQRAQRLIGSVRPPTVREVGAGVGTAVLGLALLALTLPPSRDLGPPLPDEIVASLADLPPGTAVLSDLQEGGYLLWTDPRLEVVAHGYGDVFTDAELDRNATILDVRAGWVEQLVSTGARTAVLRTDSDLAYALRREGWAVTLETGGDQLLTAPDTWPGPVPTGAGAPSAGPTLSP